MIIIIMNNFKYGVKPDSFNHGILFPLPKKSESDFMAVISKQLDNDL